MFRIRGTTMATLVFTKVADSTIWRVRRSIKCRNFIAHRIGVRMALGTSRDPLRTMITWVMTCS